MKEGQSLIAVMQERYLQYRGLKREYETISTASGSERDFINQPLMKTRSLPLAVLISDLARALHG
jgi:hypothetical protein